MILIDKRYVVFDSIDSTHVYLKNNFTDFGSGTVIVAKEQTNGIGTRGHSWYSGSDNNIAMSILYKPTCKIDRLNDLTVNIAQNIKEMFLKRYKIALDIKMPNDLLLNGKKISGILTEINTMNGKINYLIISIGFNVNEPNFPIEIQDIATSLLRETGTVFDKDEIIRGIVDTLEENIDYLVKELE